VRRAVLGLPLLALLLNSDRLRPARPRFSDAVSPNLSDVYAALPARNEGRLGRPGDPLGILFVGTDEQVRSALAAAGWTSIPLTISGCVRAGLKEFFDFQTLTSFPPMNDYRIMGRDQDMNWVRVVRPVLERHHFRLWRTGIVDARGRELWWGSGNYDKSVRWRDLSHIPDPDADRERDFLAETLRDIPGVASKSLLELPQIPRRGANDKGYPFTTDGRALLVELASPPGR
jgi:hypothetical protein